MPDRVEIHNITCPASTPATSPIEVLFGDPPAVVRSIQVVIPDGHAGMTGISLGYGHQPVLPRGPGAFISGNDEEPRFDMSNYPPGPAWSAFVCNNDTISHTWQVRIEYDEINVGQPLTRTAVISVDDIIKAGEDLAIRTQVATEPISSPVSQSVADLAQSNQLADQLGSSSADVTDTSTGEA